MSNSYNEVFEALCNNSTYLENILDNMYVNDSVWSDYEIGSLLNYINRKKLHRNEFIEIARAHPEIFNDNTLHILMTYVKDLFNECYPTTYDEMRALQIRLSRIMLVTQENISREDVAENIPEHIPENVSREDDTSRSLIENAVENLTCKICFNNKINYTLNMCGHVVCKMCMLRIIDSQDIDDGQTCPFCRSRGNDFIKLYL
jgi:hypothetical protein